MNVESRIIVEHCSFVLGFLWVLFCYLVVVIQAYFGVFCVQKLKKTCVF